MGTITKFMTADELECLPKNGERHELVLGELRTMPPAGFEHGAIGSVLDRRLGQHVEANNLGIVVVNDPGFILSRDPDTVLAPDLGFVVRSRVDTIGMTKKYWIGAPDLAVEVVSPNDKVYEVDEKVQQWLDGGTRLVWVVNPRRRTVTVYAPGAKPIILTDADVLDGQDVVPGFRIGVAEIFPKV